MLHLHLNRKPYFVEFYFKIRTTYALGSNSRGKFRGIPAEREYFTDNDRGSNEKLRQRQLRSQSVVEYLLAKPETEVLRGRDF